MEELIRHLARLSGATDENGNRASSVFCFTDSELQEFARLIVQQGFEAWEFGLEKNNEII